MAGKVTLTLGCKMQRKPVLHLGEEVHQNGVTGLKRLMTKVAWTPGSKRRINRMGIREGCDGAAYPSPP